MVATCGVRAISSYTAPLPLYPVSCQNAIADDVNDSRSSMASSLVFRVRGFPLALLTSPTSRLHFSFASVLHASD